MNCDWCEKEIKRSHRKVDLDMSVYGPMRPGVGTSLTRSVDIEICWLCSRAALKFLRTAELTRRIDRVTDAELKGNPVPVFRRTWQSQ